MSFLSNSLPPSIKAATSSPTTTTTHNAESKSPTMMKSPPSSGPPPIASLASSSRATVTATARRSESLDDFDVTNHSEDLRELMMVNDTPATISSSTATDRAGSGYKFSSASRSSCSSYDEPCPYPYYNVVPTPFPYYETCGSVIPGPLSSNLASSRENSKLDSTLVLEEDDKASYGPAINLTSQRRLMVKPASIAASTATRSKSAPQELAAAASAPAAVDQGTVNQLLATIASLQERIETLEKQPSPGPFRRTVLLTRDGKFSQSTPNLPAHVRHTGSSSSAGRRTFSTGSDQSAPSALPTMPSLLPSLPEEQSERRWGKLREALGNSTQHDFSKESTLVFLFPEEVGERDYTPEELEKIQYRPFPSRLFITNIQLEWNTVWLRTRHTDHHSHRSSFIQVQNVFMADAITCNPRGVKYALAELINLCYGMNESDYYSFACTLASAFSNRAANTEFERELLLHDIRKKAIIQERKEKNQLIPTDWYSMTLFKEEQTQARIQLLQLMDIVFSKLKQKKILVDDSKSNIYRLVLCMTKYNRNPWPYFYAIFSFFFQLCAATYVTLSLTTLDDGTKLRTELESGIFERNIALAIGTVCYGMMVAYPEMKSTGEVFRYFYRPAYYLSPLAFMDCVVNFVLPLVCTTCGFFVVLQAESFLDAVLNAVALIFITEIDDQLPRILELVTLDIVQKFLIEEAMEEYDHRNLTKKILEIEFSDMHLTNTEESGSIPSRGVNFQPYEVFGVASSLAYDDLFDEPGIVDRLKEAFGRSRKKTQGVRARKSGVYHLANQRYVTADCLLRKIEWQYTGGFDQASRPRIGHLRLHKLSDNKLVNIVGKHKAKPEMNKHWFSITGVYIITSFNMSDDVLGLRVCGSQTTDAFLRAFKYYNLWPLEKSAQSLLKRQVIAHTAEEITNNNIVLYGSKRRRPTPPTIAEISPTHETRAQAKVACVPASESPKDWDVGFARLKESPEEEENLAGAEDTEEEELCIPPL